jgi:hypothetical protein
MAAAVLGTLCADGIPGHLLPRGQPVYEQRPGQYLYRTAVRHMPDVSASGPRRELIASVSGGPFRCIGHLTREDAGQGGACTSGRLAVEGLQPVLSPPGRAARSGT